MQKRITYLTAAFLMIFFVDVKSCFARISWTVDLQTGLVYNLKLPLTIEQDGYPDISISSPTLRTYPFRPPLYMAGRITGWRNQQGLSFEIIHHKIYLENPPPEVQSFSVSHGFNMMIISYCKSKNGFDFRGGIGTTLLHAESIVRGKEDPYEKGLDASGYRVSGIAAAISVSRPFAVKGWFYINTEFKISGALANAPVVDGHASIRLVTFHLILGPALAIGGK
jgi:hypothetical protein